MNKAFFSAMGVAGAMIATAPVVGMPTQLTVPAHAQICVSSDPIPGSDFANLDTRTGIFQALSERIERSALEALAPTIGVPFIDDVSRAPPLGSTTVYSDESQATYIMRECAIIPGESVTDFSTTQTVKIPARVVAATLCDVAGLDDCRREAETTLRGSPGGADPAKKVILRTRQAISRNGTSADLIRALTDSSLIVLRDKRQGAQPRNATAAVPSFPADLAVVSAEFSP